MAYVTFFDTNEIEQSCIIPKLNDGEWYDVAVYDVGNYDSAEDAFDSGALYEVSDAFTDTYNMITAAASIQAAAKCVGSHLVVVFQISSVI